MRAGTTSLHDVLRRHPAIFMSSFKEPAYFADPDELARDSRIIAKAGYAGDRDRYLALFDPASTQRWIGESSTHYTKQPRINDVAGRIGQMSPEARIIYVIREPVARTLSHYRFEVFRRYEHRAPLEAITSDPIYVATSDYRRQIEPYLATFGRSAVSILVLEELIEQPKAVLSGLFEWLDVDPSEATTELPSSNEFRQPVARLAAPVGLNHPQRGRGYRTVIRGLLPKKVRKTLAKVMLDRRVEDQLRAPELADHLGEVLAPVQGQVEDLLGRPVTTWHQREPGSG